jgi:hypothetical protein
VSHVSLHAGTSTPYLACARAAALRLRALASRPRAHFHRISRHASPPLYILRTSPYPVGIPDVTRTVTRNRATGTVLPPPAGPGPRARRAPHPQRAGASRCVTLRDA